MDEIFRALRIVLYFVLSTQFIIENCFSISNCLSLKKNKQQKIKRFFYSSRINNLMNIDKFFQKNITIWMPDCLRLPPCLIREFVE